MLLAKKSPGFHPLKRSIMAIPQAPKSTFVLHFSIKGTPSNSYWSILDIIENRTTLLAFIYSNSTIETLGRGVKHVKS